MNEFLRNAEGLSDEEVAYCAEAARLWEEGGEDEEGREDEEGKE